MGLVWGRFGVTFGPLFAYEGDFGSISGRLWGYFGHIDVEFHVWCMCHAYMYGLGGAKKRKCWKTIGFCMFFWGVNRARDRQPNERPSNPEHFGVTLEPLWGHFGYIRMTLGHFRMTLGSLWNHFGCIRVDFQKTFIFPNRFEWFYKALGLVLGRIGVTLGPLFAYEDDFGDQFS